jgi:hypothetical protein
MNPIRLWLVMTSCLLLHNLAEAAEDSLQSEDSDQSGTTPTPDLHFGRKGTVNGYGEVIFEY